MTSKSEKKKFQSDVVKKYLGGKRITFTYEENSYKFTIFTERGTIEYWASSQKWHFLGSSVYEKGPISEVV